MTNIGVALRTHLVQTPLNLLEVIQAVGERLTLARPNSVGLSVHLEK